MKRPMPFDDQVDISSDESSSSDAEIGGLAGKQSIDDITIVQPANEIISEGNYFNRWIVVVIHSVHFHIHSS